MTDTLIPTTAVDSYLAALNETDPARRADLVALAWTPNATFVDPLLEAEGHDAIAGLTDIVQGQFPGQRFRRTTEIDGHHDLVRFGWELVAADGSVTVAGTDIGQLAGDGRLRSITGFFGSLANR